MKIFNSLLAALTMSSAISHAAVEPLGPPNQAEYAFKTSKVTQGGVGEAAFWLYEPDGAAPAKNPPLIIFMHGWAAIDPWVYSAWIDHLVRQGNVVIYPRYQLNVLTMPVTFLDNAVKGIKGALAMTQTEGHVKPDLSRVAIVGHSAGGLITAGLAGLADKSGLPKPKAICCVQPGKTELRGRGFGIPLENLQTISPETLLLCVTGDKDIVCGDADTKKILGGTAQIPSTNKAHLLQTSDSPAAPGLKAIHYAPCSTLVEPISKEDPPATANEFAALAGVASGEMGPLRAFLGTKRGQTWLHETKGLPDFTKSLLPPDALDFALWKAFDDLKEAAFTGKNKDRALGRKGAANNLGVWIPQE